MKIVTPLYFAIFFNFLLVPGSYIFASTPENTYLESISKLQDQSARRKAYSSYIDDVATQRLEFWDRHLAQVEEETPPDEPPFIDQEEIDFEEELAPTEKKPSIKRYRQPRSTQYQKPKPRYSTKGLKKITSEGVYLYETPESKSKYYASVKIGTFAPINLVNANGITFGQIYGNESKMMLLIDFEWPLWRGAGRLSLKVGSGVLITNGNGIFVSDSSQAEELYTFFMFPNNVAALYRMQFTDKQFLVPFVEAGIDYYGVIETRDDGSGTKIGGSPAIHFGGGIGISLAGLERNSMLTMDREYGINGVWLTIDYRRVQGFGGAAFDFTDDIIGGGVTVEF